MISSKLTHLARILVASLAVAGVGCMANVGDGTTDEKTATSELRGVPAPQKAGVQTGVKPLPLPEVARVGAPRIVVGTPTEEGPGPNPWKPADQAPPDDDDKAGPQSDKTPTR